MRNCLLFISDVIRTIIGSPLSNKIQKKNILFWNVAREYAADGVKLAELLFAIYLFPHQHTDSPTKRIFFKNFIGKSQTNKRTNYIICDKQSIA